MGNDRPTEVLMLHSGALGDCALTVHAARCMSRSWGDPPVTLAARSPLVRWAKRRGLIAGAVMLDDIGAHHLYLPADSVPERLSAFLDGFDLIVSFLGGPEETVSARLRDIAPAHVIAIDPKPTEQTVHLGRHITQQWLEAAGVLPDESRDVFDFERTTTGGRNVLIHPGSGGVEKCCPLEALEQLVTTLRDCGWTPSWIIGPDEMERDGELLVRRLEQIAPVVYEESIERAAEMTSHTDLYIGNDAGLTHVAALAGVRTVAIFGSSDPRVFRPLSPNVMVASFPDGDSSVADWANSLLAARFRAVRD